MKNFLATLKKESSQFSLLQNDKEIQVLIHDNLTILFTGKQILSLHTIVEAYKTKGMHLLKDLQGAFSFLLYDKVKNQLFIAKDKVGIEPLYYAYTNNHNDILISSHLKKFNKVKNFTAIINPSSVGEYMQFGFILQPNTIFKNCHKVCAGEYICFDLNHNKTTSNKYWKLEDCYKYEKTKKSEDIILKETKNLLEQVVEKHSQNSHFGLSLSGGYDSSTLAAICQSQSEQKVNTFTIGFEEKSINEAPDAKAIAKHLGTNHTEYYFTDKDALEIIPKICQIFDEPFADYATSPTILTSQLLKEEKCSTLIAGDGGDEVFATAADVHFFDSLQKIPMPLRKILAKSLNSIKIAKIPYFNKLNNLPKKQNKLFELFLANNIPQMIYARNTLFMEEELQMNIKAYQKPIKSSFDDIDFKYHSQTVDKVIGTYFKTTMVNGELMKSYAAMNHQSIQLSTPFLEVELIEYMAQIPSNIKIKNDVKKYLLKEIAHTYIPKSLLDRPKSGFDIPFSSWMRGILKDILYAQINKKRLDEDNILYTSSILKIRDQFYAGNDAYKYKLWRVFIFQLWYENFTRSIKRN